VWFIEEPIALNDWQNELSRIYLAIIYEMQLRIETTSNLGSGYGRVGPYEKNE
jgi:hypothetical protein